MATANSSNRAPTIDELTESPTGAIYVRNTSGDRYPSAADIFITVYVGSQNRGHIVKIPASWKPFNLTDQAPRTAVLGSQNFLKAVQSGVLTILNPQAAAQELATPKAIREAERLEQVQANIAAANRNPNTDEFKLTLEGEEVSEGTTESRKTMGITASFFDEEGVSTAFIAWVNKTNGMSSPDVISAAQSRGNFTTEEMQYMAENTVHPRIRNGLNKRLLSASND